MRWNNTLTQLNYYLADLYLSDDDNSTKKRLVKAAGMSAAMIAFEKAAINAWFNILDHAANRNKVDTLLEVILSPQEGNEGDEFLEGALRNIREQKDIVKGPELKTASWKATPETELHKEKMIGKRSTLLPIGFLEKGMDASRAVARIVIGDDLGTGFIIQNNWLITNNHVIDTPQTAVSARIQMNYQFPKSLPATDKKPYLLKPERILTLDPGSPEKPLFFTDPDDDWTIVKIRETDIAAFGYLPLSTKGVQTKDFVNIIQHPAGGPKQIALYNNLVMYRDDRIVQYLTDTADGSSGSPVFNSDWEVVALHHSGGTLTDPKTHKLVYRNQGTNITRINAFITKHQLI